MKTSRKTAEERKEHLAREVGMRISRGARVEYHSDFQAVLVYGRPVNHLLHFFIGLFTFLIWWVVWVALAISGGEERVLVMVNEWGDLSVSKQ